MATILAIITALGSIAALVGRLLPDPKQRRARFIDEAARRQERRTIEEEKLDKD